MKAASVCTFADVCVGQSSGGLTIDCSAIGRCGHMSQKGSTMYPGCPNSLANCKEPKSWSHPGAPSVWLTGESVTSLFLTLREAASLTTNLWSVHLLHWQFTVSIPWKKYMCMKWFSTTKNTFPWSPLSRWDYKRLCRYTQQKPHKNISADSPQITQKIKFHK